MDNETIVQKIASKVDAQIIQELNSNKKFKDEVLQRYFERLQDTMPNTDLYEFRPRTPLALSFISIENLQFEILPFNFPIKRFNLVGQPNHIDTGNINIVKVFIPSINGSFSIQNESLEITINNTSLINKWEISNRILE